MNWAAEGVMGGRLGVNWETAGAWKVENQRFALSVHRGAEEPAGGEAARSLAQY